MVKIKLSYSDSTEKEKLIEGISKGFRVLKVSKPYPRANKALNVVYVDAEAK